MTAEDRSLEIRDIHAEQSATVNIAGGDIKVGYSIEEVDKLLEKLGREFTPKPFSGKCPYPGLEAFRESDAAFFFGREAQVAALLERIKTSRFLMIAGPSGSGKSSLVRAGLLAKLKTNALPGSEEWLYATLRPGRQPLEALALAMSRAGRTPQAAEYLRNHASQPRTLHEVAESLLEEDPRQRMLLFADQFEEIFTQTSEDRRSERRTFLELLTTAASIENGRVTVLCAMRSDFISHCAPYPGLNELLNQGFFQLGALQPEELVRAVALPASEAGLRLETELVTRVVNDVGSEPGILPLMQFALRDLFEASQAGGGVPALTLRGYLERGGLHKALQRHAEAEFARLSETEQELAKSIYSSLVEIGQGAQDTRRTARFSELVPASADPAQVQALVQRLADSRLLTTSETEGQERVVSIPHERLLDAWPWLRRLVDENRQAILLKNKIDDDALEWEQSERNASYLYTGARLATAEEHLNTHQLALSALGQAFIQAGIALRQQEIERQEALRQRELEQARALTEEQRKRREEAEHRLLQAELSELKARAEQSFARAERNRLRSLRDYTNTAYVEKLNSRADEFDRQARHAWEQVYQLEERLLHLEAAWPTVAASDRLASACFSLEVIPSRFDTGLLVQYGSPSAPHWLIMDGGPKQLLAQRLEQIRIELGLAGPLEIELAVISHFDSDHLEGILDLLEQTRQNLKAGRPVPAHIKSLWFNQFFHIFSVKNFPKNRILNLGKELGIQVNEPFDYFVMPSEQGPARVTLLENINLTVIAPQPELLKLFYQEFLRTVRQMDVSSEMDSSPARDDDLERGLSALSEGFSSPQIELMRSPARLTAINPPPISDRSATNLSSLVTLVDYAGKKMLFCADARCDHIVTGLSQAGYLRAGEPLHLDLLVVPHWGNRLNVTEEFYRKVTADHYVISSNERFQQPKPENLHHIFSARGEAPFTIHLPDLSTVPWLSGYLAGLDPSIREAHFAPWGEGPVRIDLLDPA
jgi:beta-lactamase superfamily II metal-dependent hydrolase